MGDKPETEKISKSCPYCDAATAEESCPFCEPCKVTVFHCPKCLQPIPRDSKVCHHCGADIRGEALKEE